MTNVSETLLTDSEHSLLDVFRQFIVGPGEMLCLHDLLVKKHSKAIKALTDKGFLVSERVPGAYSLTKAGFDAMRAAQGA